MPDDADGGDAGQREAEKPAGPHAERVSHYEHAARLAAESHPLEGEDLNTPHLEDAQMWVSVYSELLEFKETLLNDTSRALETLPAPGSEEVRKTDAVLLTAEADRFRRRLALWKQRCEQLAGGA